MNMGRKERGDGEMKWEGGCEGNREAWNCPGRQAGTDSMGRCSGNYIPGAVQRGRGTGSSRGGEPLPSALHCSRAGGCSDPPPPFQSWAGRFLLGKKPSSQGQETEARLSQFHALWSIEHAMSASVRLDEWSHFKSMLLCSASVFWSLGHLFLHGDFGKGRENRREMLCRFRRESGIATHKQYCCWSWNDSAPLGILKIIFLKENICLSKTLNDPSTLGLLETLEESISVEEVEAFTRFVVVFLKIAFKRILRETVLLSEVGKHASSSGSPSLNLTLQKTVPPQSRESGDRGVEIAVILHEGLRKTHWSPGFVFFSSFSCISCDIPKA